MRVAVCRLGELEHRGVDRSVRIALVFASRDKLADPKLSEALSRTYPDADVCGCSSGGQILGSSVVDDDAVVAGLAFERTEVRLATANAIPEGGSARTCGRALGRRLESEELSTILVFADGIDVGGNELVEGLVDSVGPSVTIVGGLAADREDFTRTSVVVNGATRTGQVAAIGFYGSNFHVHTGVCSGWQVFGPHRRVTRAVGNRVYELDGESVVSLYRRYLDDEDFAGLPRTALLFPLQVWPPDAPEKASIRAVLDMDRDDGALVFGDDIAEGSIAQLMRGSFDRLIDCVGDAAGRAIEGISAAKASRSFALIFSCIGRRLILASRTEDEILSIGEVLADVPRLGLYSLGEICRPAGSNGAGLHNESVVIAIFSEEA